MAQEGEEGPVCRVCWADEPPRGLADLLLDQPCGCRGHLGRIHLSCLHTWQLQRLHFTPLSDISKCDVCRQPYNVPEQLWEALVAAGGINGGKRQRVRERLQLEDPAQLTLLVLQLQVARLRQDLQQAQGLEPRAQHVAQFRHAAQQRRLMLARVRQAAEALQWGQQQVPAQLEQLQLLQQELRQLEQGYRALLEALQPTLPQATAELLHAMREGGGWFTKPVKLFIWCSHALPAVLDSSELPATEPPQPSVLRRLLPNGYVTAGVLAILALSERRQLGSWEAVWREGYSAQFAKRTAWQLGWLALLTWVGQAADPGHSTPGAPSRQPVMAAFAEASASFCLLLASMSLSYWPSLLSLMRWLPLAYWAALRSLLSWLPQACWAALCRLFCRVPFPPFPPPKYPAMPALVEYMRLVQARGKQMGEDEERAALASQCLALLQQRRQALRLFVDALTPRCPSVPTSPGLFARLCATLSRFLPFLASSQ